MVIVVVSLKRPLQVDSIGVVVGWPMGFGTNYSRLVCRVQSNKWLLSEPTEMQYISGPASEKELGACDMGHSVCVLFRL